MSHVLDSRPVRILGSYGLAIAILLLLLLLTFLGTIEQARMSLFDVQEKYFDSAFVVYRAWGVVPILLPGAYLLLSLLFLNLLVGGMIRMRKGRQTLGIMVIHIGIAFLLFAGFVEARLSTKGHMTLYEGESSDLYQSYYESEVVIAERLADGKVREHVVPDEAFDGMEPGDTLTVTDADLPFDLVLQGFLRNARPRGATPEDVEAGLGVDGVYLEALPAAKQAEANTPGVYATVIPKDGSAERRGLLYGLQGLPWPVAVGDRRFEIDLHRRRWHVPFRVRLDRFVHEMHPGTAMPRRFSSYVTKIEDGIPEKKHVTMNEPLRDEGYTFYQSGWGPQDSPRGPWFSTFAVVKNPSDRWPLWSCIVIAIGLLLHFGQKLVNYLKAEARRRAAATEGAR